MINRSISNQGWIVIVGVPALFFCAYLIGSSPALFKLPLCAVKMFAGVDCPGCGLTRSIAFLVHGQIKRSIDFNPMGIVVSVWLVFLFIKTLIPFKTPLSQKSRDIMLACFVAALIIQWLIKLFFSFHFQL